MKIPEDIKITYEQLLCTITQAMTWSQKGNIPETKNAIENISERYLSLRLRFNALGHTGGLDKLLEKTQPEEMSRMTAKVISYAEAPEMFLAEAYLVSAEEAMKEDRDADAKDAYKHIKPGEQLRRYLDSQITPINNLKKRAEKLDKLVKKVA